MTTSGGHVPGPAASGRLANRVVVVTGAAAGIGAAVSDRFAAEGAFVVVADKDASRAQDVAGRLGPQHLAVPVDVADERSVSELFDLVADSLGPPTDVVHCAGIGMHRRFLELSVHDWRLAHAVNLEGTFLVCREAARRMIDAGAGGSLVNVSSAAALVGTSMTAAYSSTKGGVVAFTRAIAVELAPEGIRANSLCPGPVATELVQQSHSPAMRAAFERRVPMGRYARPEEVAGAAVFLCSDDASNVTGAVISVDGGYTSAGVILEGATG